MVRHLPTKIINSKEEAVGRLVSDGGLFSGAGRVMVKPSRGRAVSIRKIALRAVPKHKGRILLHCSTADKAKGHDLRILSRVSSDCLSRLYHLTGTLELRSKTLSVIVPGVCRECSTSRPRTLVFLGTRTAPRLSVRRGILLVKGRGVTGGVIAVR